MSNSMPGGSADTRHSAVATGLAYEKPDSPALSTSLVPQLAPTPPGEDAFAPLRAILTQYMEPAEVEAVHGAFVFGAHAHLGQARRSGEPYILHPLSVAAILAELRLDLPSVQAAILHDVIEDTGVSKEELHRLFGETVAELVDGVTKLGKVHFDTAEEAQAENFRKMLLAMSKDIRVVLIKLGDRLHNMRTMGVLPSEKRRRISRETLEIYAPIAQRLGINPIRIELEELAFAHLYPKRWYAISEALRAARGNRKEVVAKIKTGIEERLRQEQVQGRVEGREKHVYSIYRKMQKKNLSFAAVNDIYAFRIMVANVDTCYRVLGQVHNLFKPIPGRFKDYIAIPKPNGYQSLHTVVFGPFGHPIEIQIRTEDMHRVAEAGVAAHWLYKSGESSSTSAQQQARAWLQQLLELQKQGGDSREFLESVKMDLFPDQVYVFTPKGKIIPLPHGSTPVDFAYAVHTDIGNHCIAAKVNEQFVPLRSSLRNGDHIEIITAPSASPNPSWLDFVVTGKARSNIRAHLKNMQHAEAEAMGKRLLDKALRSLGGQLSEMQERNWQPVLKDFRKDNTAAIYEAIGMGELLPFVVAHHLLPHSLPAPSAEQNTDTISFSIRGTEGMPLTLARCCRPIPGDNILGFVTAGRGIVVHTHDCPNIHEWRKRRDQWIDVQWDPSVKGEYPVAIRAVVENARGVLAQLATCIAEAGSNINQLDMEEKDGLYTGISFTIEVTDRSHLARVMRALRSLPVVSRISRLKG